MNAWVLAKDLDEISNATNDPDLKRLCGLVREHYKYPVDTVLISSELKVLGHKNVKHAMIGPVVYEPFLRKGLGEDVVEPEVFATDRPPEK